MKISGNDIKGFTVLFLFILLIGISFYFFSYKPRRICENKTCPNEMTTFMLNGSCICLVVPK